MGLRFERRKPRRIWLSVAYRLHRWVRLPVRMRLTFYLNAHWMFGRLAHEESHRLFGGQDHPLRGRTEVFLDRHLTENDSVVDLGCGNGMLASWVADRVARVVGVDHDRESIDLASTLRQTPSLSFVHDDAGSFLEASDERFDVLLLSHVLEHLDDPEAFLARVAKGFRSVYIEVPDFEASFHNRLREVLGLSLAYADDDHISEFGRSEIEALIEDAGLTITDMERVEGVQRMWCDREEMP